MSIRKQLTILLSMFVSVFVFLSVYAGFFRGEHFFLLLWEMWTSQAKEVCNYTMTALEKTGEEPLAEEVLAVLEDEKTGKILLEETKAAEGVAESTKEEPVENETKQMQDVSLEKLKDFDYLLQNYYVVDQTTAVQKKILDAEKLLAMDLTIKGKEDGPKILIYHTHSQEGYKKAKEGETVVALGKELAEILEEEYGIPVLHHTGEYDVEDRDHAYSLAAPDIEKILEENPSIEVIIDLHRDGVAKKTHLVTEIDGKQVAQIMFFNGLSYTTGNGELEYLANPYIQENLALSLQLKWKAQQLYPTFVRPIYLKGYRYNLHFLPKSMLVEVGAQTNTFEEAKNAMPYLAEILAEVLLPK